PLKMNGALKPGGRQRVGTVMDFRDALEQVNDALAARRGLGNASRVLTEPLHRSKDAAKVSDKDQEFAGSQLASEYQPCAVPEHEGNGECHQTGRAATKRRGQPPCAQFFRLTGFVFLFKASGKRLLETQGLNQPDGSNRFGGGSGHGRLALATGSC